MIYATWTGLLLLITVGLTLPLWPSRRESSLRAAVLLFLAGIAMAVRTLPQAPADGVTGTFWASLTAALPLSAAALLLFSEFWSARCRKSAAPDAVSGGVSTPVRFLGRLWHLAPVAVSFVVLHTAIGMWVAQGSHWDPGTVNVLVNAGAALVFTAMLGEMRHERLRAVFADDPVPRSVWCGTVLVAFGLQAGFHLLHFFYFPALYPRAAAVAEGGPAPVLGTYLVASLVVAPAFEEFFFRSIVIERMEQNLPRFQCVVGSGLLFALCHCNLVQFFHTFALGCFLAWIYVRTRSLAVCVVGHFVFNLSPYLLMVLLIPVSLGFPPAGLAVILVIISFLTVFPGLSRVRTGLQQCVGTRASPTLPNGRVRT